MLASVSVIAFFFLFRGMRTPLVLANSASLVLKGVAEEQIVNLPRNSPIWQLDSSSTLNFGFNFKA